MLLTDRLRGIASEAKAIRESMTIVDPRHRGADLSLGVDAGDRLINRRGGEFQRRVAEAAKLMADVYAGRRPSYHLQEAMTTSDFPLLFGDLLYRQLLGNYAPYPVTYPNWTRVVEVNDFRNLNLYTIDGGQAILTKVAERAPYPEIAFTEGRYQVAVAKYGRRYSITFEMVVNDDLNAFQQRPALMAVGARRSEEYLATTMLVDVNGPHASFFTAGHANIVTNNPPLSIQALQTAMTVVASQTDTEGQPIVIESFTLLVPPALEITAQNIINALQIRINSSTGSPAGAANGGGTIDQFLYAENWMKSKVRLAVNPYIPYVASTANGSTSWFLIANPNDPSSRPAFVFAFMRGRRQPQLFIKSPDAQQLGGGSDPMEGNFDTDSIDYKLRHIFGATQVDPKMAVSSNGSGS